MTDMLQFSIARKALKKLYPSWQLFIDEVMDLLQPFWLGTQSREAVHFIHLIGYGKRQKAREILTDLLELLDWQSESVILWENWDVNAPSSLAQVQAFQEAYPIFPKVVLTDFFNEFFLESELCRDGQQVEIFLRERKKLDFSYFEISPSDARGSLIISFLDSFGDCDFLRTRLMFQFLWSKSESTMDMIRKSYVPDELLRISEKDYFRKGELVFFSKDEPIHILLAIELQRVTQALEEEGSKLLGLPVKLTLNAMDYFLSYIFYKRLSNLQLHRAAIDFFLPVFRQFPRMTQKISLRPERVVLDFKGGWKFTVIE
ncbi:MAG: hypothetical protein ACK4HU_21090 [Algoriphagus sp.]